MKVQSLAIGVIALLSGACGQAKYEFVKDDIVIDNPSDLTDTPDLPPLPPSNPHEFHGENGFWIKVTPGQVHLGKLVTFTGNCGFNNSGVLDWQFGDGTSGRGTNINRTYQTSGTFEVEATCTETDRTVRRGTIKVIILPPANTGDEIGDPGQSPGQNPGQSPHQRPSPCTRIYNPCSR